MEKNDSYNFEIKGEIIPSSVVQYWECPTCGEAFFDHEANRKIDAVLLNKKKQKMRKTDYNVVLISKDINREIP